MREIVTNTYTVVEAHATVLRAVGSHAGREFLLHGLEGIGLLPVRTEEEERAKELVVHRLDKHYSLCDAISFAVMEQYDLSLAFAFDDHFRQHGFSTPLGQTSWP